MKKYTGKVRVKSDSRYVYAGTTLNIIGVHNDYKNGNGLGVFADGTRDYKLSLVNTKFEEKFGKYTILHDSNLEILELNETLILPLDENEVLQLLAFVRGGSTPYNLTLLNAFIQAQTKPSVLPIPDLSTIYDDSEFDKKNNNGATNNIPS